MLTGRIKKGGKTCRCAVRTENEGDPEHDLAEWFGLDETTAEGMDTSRARWG